MNKPAVKFRRDINALRAVAVIVVVLFHFGVPGFAGGFVGVDIFFVISGYLMTGILFRHDPLSVRDVIGFYVSRGRRILPALLVLCLVLLVLGWFWLPPTNYADLAAQTVSSTFFLSNVLFWKQAGYFAVDSEYKWLLHTWSLSVEWQFYLLYPIFVWAISRSYALKARVGLLVSLISAISFALCVFVAGWKPSAGFFLLPTRAWEMLVGGLVFIYGSKIRFSPSFRLYLSFFGFLIITIFVVIRFEGVWPSMVTALPVAGALMVISANLNRMPLLDCRAIQTIGLWSYSGLPHLYVMSPSSSARN